MGEIKGIQEHNRALLDELHRSTTGPFSVAEAADILGLSPRRVGRLLAYLVSRGWLSRVRRGTYLTVPLGVMSPSDWREDAWIVAHQAFSPCYIAGWSACENWELTEQIFRDVVVITATSIRTRRRTIQGTRFFLKFLRREMHFGTRPVWRRQTRIEVSDPSRTVADILDDPEIGAGIRHCADVLRVYFAGDERDDDKLFEYIKRRNNRAVFKRLGYLVEALEIDAPELLKCCLESQSSGVSALDPSASKKGRILKRWNLRVNTSICVGEEPS